MFARRTIYSFQRTTSVMLQIFYIVEEKQKNHITFARKTKVSYYMLLREKQKYHITSHSCPSKLS